MRFQCTNLQWLEGSSRSSDILARMGGDEFVVVLLDTDHAGAEQYSRKLRKMFFNSGLKQQYGIDF
ncbi:diguanylate cyclase domain-containing protein [Acinetobacter bohemicus]|uniref:diguanylate cyclase domain-containing protein n=1 Tax=Acinetobacter bohemicus TaxID=1435036 RepID=UPI001D0E9F6E|nr:diguanylate cyclase [Acinetobacter bohemicus]